MTHIQEFFSSKDNDSRLVQLLTESGFTRIPEWQAGFKAENTFVNVQEVKDERHVVAQSGVGHRYCFVLELYKPLDEFDSNHPLRNFFRQLQEPRAYGLCGIPPEYRIEDYV